MHKNKKRHTCSLKLNSEAHINEKCILPIGSLLSSRII